MHKERYQLVRALKELHDEIKPDYTVMIYAIYADEPRKISKTFLAK